MCVTKSVWRKSRTVQANATATAPADAATNFKVYAEILEKTIKCVIRERVIEEKPENPRIQADGEALAAVADLSDADYILRYNDRTVSAVGLTGLILMRAVDLVAAKAARADKGMTIDVTDTVFEGGVDMALAQRLVEWRGKKLPITVVGDDSVAAYVQVRGRVSLKAFPVEDRVRQFKRILPGTVLRLDRYNDKRGARTDIAGRRGFGVVVNSSVVIFEGVDAESIRFSEINTDSLYTDADIEDLGLIAPTETLYKRRMDIADLGVNGWFTGTFGCFRRVGAGEFHTIAGGETLEDAAFIRRGLEYRGISYAKSVYGRIVPPTKK